jgi:FixJ family two-component response regulator
VQVSAGRPYIAVVDDDEPVRKALSRLLRTADFTVESFSSGRKLLESLKVRCPDCIVLDYQMPLLNGLNLLKNLRSLGIPVVMITAHDEAIVRANCMAAGASAYLRKPIDEMVLRRAIVDAIG